MNRKCTFLILFFFISQSLSGQVITADWFMQPGDTSKHIRASNPEEMTVPIGGINMTWDFSNANPNTFSETEDIIVSPQDLIYFNEFPSATIGAKSQGIEFFYKHTEDSLSLIGVQIAPEAQQRYVKPYLIMKTPFALDSQFVHQSEVHVYLNEDPFDTISITETKSFFGTGTVITPEGTFHNCIGVKTIRTTHNSLDSINTFYIFYKNSLSKAIAALGFSNTSNTIESFHWLTHYDEISSVVDVSELEIKLIQNSLNQYSLKSNSSYTLDLLLFDFSGKLVWSSKDQRLSPVDNQIELPEGYLIGTYLLLVINKKTNQFKSFKITRF